MIYAFQNQQPIETTIRLPLNQVQMVLYYGFQGQSNMITHDVEKRML